VQIAASTGFSTIVDQVIVDGTDFAPRMMQPQYATAKRLYWRVAAVDEGGNIGGWATAALRAPLPLRVGISGRLHRGHRAALRVRVTDRHGHRLYGAHVRVTGPGMTAVDHMTSRRGTATLRLRPRAKGSVTVKVSLRGYITQRIAVRVRR
jgi:hypothetical protein